jgi:hypothetical protein
VAARRSLDFDDIAMKGVFNQLDSLYAAHEATGSYSGQIRCGLESVRGRLEYLNYWRPDNARRGVEEGEISKMLAKLDAAIEKGGLGRQDWRAWRGWSTRTKLLSLRFSLHKLTVDSGGSLLHSSRESLVNALADLDREVRGTHLEVEQKILHGQVESLAQRYSEAIRAFQRASDCADEDDPVLKAECFLQLAEGYRIMNEFVSAEEAHENWRRISRAVDNAYLHRFASSIRRALDAANRPFVLRPGDDLNWKRCEHNLRLWLGDAARIKAAKESGEATGKAIAEVLGIDASSWTRWPKR